MKHWDAHKDRRMRRAGVIGFTVAGLLCILLAVGDIVYLVIESESGVRKVGAYLFHGVVVVIFLVLGCACLVGPVLLVKESFKRKSMKSSGGAKPKGS